MGTRWIKTLLGLAGGYVAVQQGWVLWQVSQHHDGRAALDTPNQYTGTGTTFLQVTETQHYIKQHVVTDGIERISYVPHHKRFETSLVFQHGMWHGAWCWAEWQALLAEQGWESHAHSLPGHANSPMQRPIRRCTLDYYLSFLAREVKRHVRSPVLIGHSMGGALTQWYLKFVGDDLAAAVLVAPWVSHSMFADGLVPLLMYDPVGVLLMIITWDATPLMRLGAGSALRFLIGPRAGMSLEELYLRLGPESALVLYQHNPPFWSPPTGLDTPILWIAGEDDPLLLEAAERRSAAHYRADYYVAPEARHNVMMEHNYRETARRLHTWLSERLP